MVSKSPLRSVLVIDDDAAMRDLLSSLLDSAGLTVAAVGSVAEAKTNGTAAAPDLIILDVVLQDSVGTESLQALDEDDVLSTVPVVFITAMSSPSPQSDLVDSRAIGVLSKPVDPANFAAQVVSYWDGYVAAAD